MTLSVIVPVYNTAADDMLKHCMDSLVNQTIPHDSYEIIAVDDCSTDDSFAILKEYEAKFPERVHVLQTERNLHQGGAKNLGLSIAKGEWIGFIDADDYVTPDYYETLLNAAEKEGADMAGCDYSMVDHYTLMPGKTVSVNDVSQTGPLDKEKYASLILDSGSLVVKIYRRHIIFGEEEPGEGIPHVFPEDIFYEDNAVSNTFMLRAKHFAYVRKPLYFYLQHCNSTVHTITKKRLSDRMEAGELMLEDAKQKGYFDTYREEIVFSFTVLYYVNTLFSAMPSAVKMDGKYAFCKELAERMKEHFPEFRTNRYYRERIHEEERKLIDMQMKSHLRFYVYYRLLWAYRDMRNR